MKLTLRTQRLRLTWLLALPFLLFARPTSVLILAGFSFALPGLLLRVWASGYVDKDRTLAVHGPYAHLRHPLYLGSFLVGVGLVAAGGVWVFFPVYLVLFLWIYLRAAQAEEEGLALLFGDAFREFRRRVPTVFPRGGGAERRLSPVPPEGVPVHTPLSGGPDSFRLRLFVQNRGWEAPLGTLGGFGLLWLKMVFFP